MNFKWSHNQFFFTELITNLLEIKILQKLFVLFTESEMQQKDLSFFLLMSKVGQNVCDTLVYSSINNLEYTDLYSLQSFDVILINH